MNEEIIDYIECYIDTMTEEERKHIVECAIKLMGTDDLVNLIYNYSLVDFINLNIMSFEELRYLKIVLGEVDYLKNR